MKAEKDIYEERVLRWAKKLKGVQLLGGRCMCGIDNPLVLDFHHNHGDKEHEVSDIIKFRWSRIEAELSKCILLCANCHMEFHCSEHKNEDKRKRVLKTKLLEIKGQTSCTKCGYGNACSLDFHHFGEKNIDIASYVFDRLDISIEEIITEMENCIVLCRNCHRVEHYGQKFKEMLPDIEKKMGTYKELQKPICRNDVYVAYDNGMIQTDIAKMFNCSKSTVSMIVRERQSDHLLSTQGA